MRLAPLILGLLALGACQTEERVVYNRPMFAGLPGVESNQPITDSHPRGSIQAAPVPTSEITLKSPDGKKTLISRSGHHLMAHVYTTLMENDETTFLDQVLSARTKEEYYERGLQPREAFAYLREHLPEIKQLFDRMPMGEFTPGLYLEPVGRNVQRLELHAQAAKNLVWTGFDMSMEEGNFHLRWFVGPGPKPPEAEITDENPDEPAPKVVSDPGGE